MKCNLILNLFYFADLKKISKKPLDKYLYGYESTILFGNHTILLLL